MKTHALDLNRAQWQSYFVSLGEKPFLADQVLEWLYKNNILDPLMFSNISLSVRKHLAAELDWTLPLRDTILPSADGSEKILLKATDGRFFECVLMPTENRVTLCVSSQVGCRMACNFCQTGKMGFFRDLSLGEILVQVLVGNMRLKERGEHRKVTNVVFMGMGEPLDNYDNVVSACKIMLDPKLFGLSKHRVTVSTSGLVPAIQKLGHDVPVALAISLHTADDEQRAAMMPINKTYPLDVLKAALLEYPASERHGITFEYVMIDGVNDSIQHAKKLVRFLHGIKAKVNLIPMNAHPGSDQKPSSENQLKLFQSYLAERSIPAPIRYSKGQDISAACGQLATKRAHELDEKPRIVSLTRHKEWLQYRRQPKNSEML